MDKKGVIKISVIVLISFLLLALIFSSLFSSASTIESYYLGEELKMDLTKYNPCFLKIKSPSGIITQDTCNDKLSLRFIEEGEYTIDIKSEFSLERLKFQVKSNKEEYILFDFKTDNSYSIWDTLKFDFNGLGNYELLILSPSGKRTSRVSSNDIFFFDLLEEGVYSVRFERGNSISYYKFSVNFPAPQDLTQGKAEIGKPVTWNKHVKEADTLSLIEIPSITNLELKKENGEIFVNYDIIELEEKKFIQFKETISEELILEYITEPPKIEEKIISENKKEIVVSSPEDVHYQEVLSYTTIPEKILVGQEKLIKIYWREEGTYLNFVTKDTNNNGIIDYVEWIVPHLSNQTFEIIIITKAEHLDLNRLFISDIYEDVKELDNIWSETINEGEYVRVTFEVPLDNTRDITLFPRIVSGDPKVEVYEINSDVKIAEFSDINSNEYNKIYLTNLISETQDTFDLKVVGGGVEFDHIIDPIYNYLYEDWEHQTFDNWTNTAWTIVGDRAQGSYSSKCATNANCNMYSDTPIDTSGALWVNLSFMYNDDDCDRGDVILYFYDNLGNWDNMGNIDAGSLGTSDDTWHTHVESSTSSQYFHENFAIRFWADPDTGGGQNAENYWVDNVNLTVFKLSYPTYSGFSVNNTVSGKATQFSIYVDDDSSLNPSGAYIFSTNNSGTWVNDSSVNFATTPSWANVTKTLTSTIGAFVGYRWYFINTNGLRNSTPIYTLTTTDIPPSSNLIQCEQGGEWRYCSEIDFGETITRVRANCTISSGYIVNATFNLTNIPDGNTFFSANATSNESDWWIYDNPDLTINDSGDFNLSASCWADSFSTSLSNLNWSVPWGSLELNLVDPSSNTNVNPKEFFNFTASVTCTGGECGDVNATLDPAGSWWDTDYENRRLINITNPSSSILVQNYSMLLVVDTTGIDFQDDGDDLRIVYWNGTHNREIDRFNDTFFNIDSTNIWFRIQSNISSEGYDDNYYMYYNNSDASNPPNNGSKVFEFFDNFNRADSGTIGNGWTETTGTWQIIGGWVRNTNNGDSDLTRTTITTNHSIRALANQVIDDADLKLSLRSSLSPTGGYTFGYQNGYLELTSGNHNTANLGSTAISTMAGVPYELEINTFNNRITTYKDGALIFNVSDSSASSGFTLIHSWDVSEFDDFWIRKLIDVEPTYSFGDSERRSKGIISTITGDTPFYTISRNPMDYIGTSCLYNLKPGIICNITWQVNATGKVGSVWEFFVYANTTSYSSYFNESVASSRINITIGNVPPEIPELNFPINDSALTSIGEFNWSNSIDQTGDKVYYGIEISNSSNFSHLIYYNYSLPEISGGITGVTPTGITQEGVYYWRVFATDLKSNSSWSEIRLFYYDSSDPIVKIVYPINLSTLGSANMVNFVFNVSDLSKISLCNLVINNSIIDYSTSIVKDINQTFSFFLPNSYYSWKINCTDSAGRVGDSGEQFFTLDVSNNPPSARNIQCENGEEWKYCSEIGFGETITRVRTMCYDPEDEAISATFNLTNIPDDYLYFSNSTTNYDSEYWTLDIIDIEINDSGEFNLTATCYDVESLSGTNYSAWEVPWGSFSIDLLNPNSDTSVMKNSFFTFSSRINCIGGECGDANVTLDPPNWWNESWDYRTTINITNSGSTLLSNFPIYINLSKEYEMQNDFDDIMFINGSCGSTGTYLSLDYEIEDYTSSKADVWVNIPFFVPGVNQICMYYNNPYISSGQNSIDVWDNNYLTVQHLEETGTGTRYDSKYRRNFTTSGYDNDEKVSGKIDGADLLDGNNDALNSTANFLNNLGSFTIEGWIKPRVWGSRVSLIGQNDVVEFFLDGSNTVMVWTSGGGSTSVAYPYSLDTWHHITAVGTGSNILIYFDGVQAVSGGSSTSNYGTSSYSVKIGEGVVDASGGYFNGSIDEVRISNTTRSADWINQSYQIVNNQNNLVSFGVKEEKTKGIISTVIGATPFYTTTPNPLNSTTFSCLENMKSSGSSCDVSWNVNATGELNSVWEFFVSSNNLNYHDYHNMSSNSQSINITIASQVPPSVPQLYLPPNETAYSTIPILNWTNSTDQNEDNIYYILQVSNVSDFSSIIFANYSIPETSSPTWILPIGITQEGAYYWRVRATDLFGNSSWSETRVFYYDLSAPTIGFINQTGEDNRIINNTNWLNRGENLTMQVNVSDVNTDKVWVVIWQSVVGGIEKVKVFFTNVGNFLWKADVPTNQTWDGFYNYTIYANDTLGSQINYSSNFTILGGNITINIAPSYLESISNITVSGHVNLTNTTNLSNYPINIWIDGELLSLFNLTGEGIYDYYKDFQETSNTEFSQGTFYNTEIQNNENITLSSGETSGNFTKILDAGAMVSWNNLSWNFQGASCSGVLSYQEGDVNSYSSTKDSYISSGTPNTNYGTNTAIIVDGSPTSDRGLLKFENLIGRGFYQVPENSTINNANLTFYVSDTGDQVSVYQVLENWTESEVTYNNRLTGIAWESTGCGSTPSRSTILEDAFTASSMGVYTINVTNSIKSWTLGSSNNGWIFNMPTSNGISMRSSEYSIQSERPRLIVDYQASECTNILVYVRTSNDKLTWTSWKEVSNGGPINDSNLYSRYLEYKVELTSVNSTITPVLKDITINYTSITTDSNGDYKYNFTSPSEFGNYNIAVNTSFKHILIENQTQFYVQTGLPPSVFLISPEDNQWFSQGELNLTYNISDLNNDVTLSELIINGVFNQTNLTSLINYGYNNFSINFSSGQYNWTVNVTDKSGYVNTTPQRTFYIDLINPNISLVYPGEGDSFDVNELNLSFNATDNMDSNLTCNVILDGNTIRTGVGALTGEITNISSGMLMGGIHYWNVTCTDNALRSFTSSTFSFNISDTPPNVTLVSPIVNYLDNDGIISFIYNVTDNSGILNCSIYINNVFNQTNTSPVLNYQNNAFDVEGFLEGEYNWTVECFDLSSSSYKPYPRNLSMDLYKPSITLYSPANFGNSSNSDVYFNFTVNDSYDSSLGCNLTINNLIVDEFNVDSGVLYSKLVSNITDGIKFWNITCIDDALHSNTSSTWSVNITEYPQINLNTPNNSRFNTSLINLSYTPSDNTNLSSCTLYLNGVFNQTNSTPVLNNQQNYFSINNPQEGIYNWYVFCVDYVGLSNQSETRMFYADRTPPQINVLFPKGEDIYASNITFNFSVIDYTDTNMYCNITINSSVMDTNFTVENNTLTSRTISGIDDGYNLWSLTCWDESGNINTSQTFNFTRYTNPRVTLISPENNTWFNTDSLELTYLPEDDSGIVNASLYINGIYNRSNSSQIINRAYNLFTITGFSDGSYFWNINVTDPTGLTGIDIERRFYVDLQAPKIKLNSPYESQVIESNNVTFNFSSWDNLAEHLICNFTLDGELESSNVYYNNSNILRYSILSDGDHFWKIDCSDNASNINSSDTINFTVEAPPLVELIDPIEDFRTTSSLINFSYVPYDLIDITSCNLYIDGIFNSSNNSVTENLINNFSVNGIAEGMHNWTVNCSDSDNNWNWSVERIFYRDISPPSIILNSPENESGIDFNEDRVYFNWTAIDVLDNTLQCNLTIDGIVRRPNVWVTNATSKREYVLTSVLGQGEHSWNLTCWDQLGNTNTSELRKFNLTYPDFSVNSSEIFLNETSPRENQTIEIIATIRNLAGADITNVTVSFYNGDPDSGGYKIGSDIFTNISKFGQVNLTQTWFSQIGSSEIFVLVDPPLATNGTHIELNESNNKASKMISVGSWHFFYGDVLTSSNLVLANSNSTKLINWSTQNFNQGNIYVADYDSYVSWTSLQAIGKNKLNLDSNSDFLEIDLALDTNSFEDSVYSVYTNSGVPKYVQNIYSFNHLLQQVPIINSTNNSNFVTGILWDFSDDTNGSSGEFDLADKEDLVFISPINKQSTGTYGTYDYELRVPARLREYNSEDTKTAAFYVEIF